MSRPVRLTLIILGILAAVIVLVGATALVLGGRILQRTMTVAAERLDIPADSAAVARGEHLATIFGCTDCHGPDLGGRTLVDNAAFAYLVAPNLTTGRGGVGAMYSDAELERAVRHGVGRDGRLLMIMPSREYNTLTDEDMVAVIAYLHTVPPADNEISGRTLGPVGRVVSLRAQGELFPALAIDHGRPHRARVEQSVGSEYGRYLAGGCTGCHGMDYTGGVGPNLTPDTATGIGAWSFDDFRRALQEGQRPDGVALDSAMPWYVFAHMTGGEVESIWSFLRSLPPREGVARRAAGLE